MSSMALRPRLLGPRVGDRLAVGGRQSARDIMLWAIIPPGSNDAESRRGTGASFGRILAGEVIACPILLAGAIGLYIVPIAPSLLALLPVAMTGLFLRVMSTLFPGIS